MRRLLFILGLILMLSCVSSATPITFFGLLSGANENPVTTSPGMGTANVAYDPPTHLLAVAVAFSGLESGTTAAHIHCCIAPNGNAEVATTVPTFAGFPLNVISGSYANMLDLTLASSFNPMFITDTGGTVAGAEAALAAGLENGTAYLNIHTSTFPGGAIRAFLVAVPEPGSALLVVTALAGLCLMTRRKRQGP